MALPSKDLAPQLSQELSKLLEDGLWSWLRDACPRIKAFKTHFVGSEDVDHPDPTTPAYHRFTFDDPSLALEWHCHAQPTRKFNETLQFVVLGGSVAFIFYEEERSSTVVCSVGKPSSQVELRRLSVANRLLRPYSERYEVVTVKAGTFFEFNSHSPNTIVLMCRSDLRADDKTAAVSLTPTHYYWTQEATCRHRGEPRASEVSKGLSNKQGYSLVYRLLPLVGPQPDIEREKEVNLSGFVGGVVRLRDTLSERIPPQLVDDDKTACKLIATCLNDFIILGGTLSEASRALSSLNRDKRRGLQIKQEMNGDKVMLNRFVLFDDDSLLALKVHMFQRPDESHRHNHTTAVISVALRGSYTHRIYTLQALSDGEAATTLHVRDDNGKIVPSPEPLNRSLKESVKYTFSEGNAYYLAKSTFHTVQAANADSDELLATRSMVTLFIKDRFKPPNCKSEFADVPEGEEGQEVDVKDRARAEELLELAHRRIRGGATSRESRTPFALLRTAWKGLFKYEETNEANWKTWVTKHNQPPDQRLQTAFAQISKALGGSSDETLLLSSTVDNELFIVVATLEPSTHWSKDLCLLPDREVVPGFGTIISFDFLASQRLPVRVLFAESRTLFDELKQLEACRGDAAATYLRALRSNFPALWLPVLLTAVRLVGSEPDVATPRHIVHVAQVMKQAFKAPETLTDADREEEGFTRQYSDGFVCASVADHYRDALSNMGIPDKQRYITQDFASNVLQYFFEPKE